MSLCEVQNHIIYHKNFVAVAVALLLLTLLSALSLFKLKLNKNVVFYRSIFYLTFNFSN